MPRNLIDRQYKVEMTIPNLFYTHTKRDLLKLTGKDRQSFLQGMVTNDVVKLQPGEGCYAFLLDSTGHVLADMHVLNVGDYLLLDLEPGMATFVSTTLDKYLIMEKCRITDVTDDWGCFVVGGERRAEGMSDWAVPNREEILAGQPFNDLLSADGETVLFVGGRFASSPMYRFYFTRQTEIADRESVYRGIFGTELAAELLPDAALDALRIEAGIPRFGVDIDKTVLAPEVRQDARAVSYKKGCYIGQEIVARIDARGHTNKGLVGFFLDPAQTALPEQNTPVFTIDGKQVGRITSAAVSPTLGVPIALGYLRNEHAAPGTSLFVGATDGPAIQVATLPFVGGND
jgi:folate-binding protein YgfZ